MNILSVCVLAVVTVIFIAALRPKNAEIALLLGVGCSVLILVFVLSQAQSVVNTVNSIVAAAQISTGYIAILLKVIGICLVTEFAVNTCRDAGSQALAHIHEEVNYYSCFYHSRLRFRLFRPRGGDKLRYVGYIRQPFGRREGSYALARRRQRGCIRPI